MVDLFDWLFRTAGFVPRFYCLNCVRELMWWYFANNLLIALAYYLIPVSLLVFHKYMKLTGFVSKYKHLIWMFALFIFSCGTGHIINIVMLWYPIYNFSIFWDGITAFVSLGTLGFIISALIDFFHNNKKSQ